MSLDGQSGFYVAAKSDMGIDVFCTGVIESKHPSSVRTSNTAFHEKLGPYSVVVAYTSATVGHERVYADIPTCLESLPKYMRIFQQPLKLWAVAIACQLKIHTLQCIDQAAACQNVVTMNCYRCCTRGPLCLFLRNLYIEIA